MQHLLKKRKPENNPYQIPPVGFPIIGIFHPYFLPNNSVLTFVSLVAFYIIRIPKLLIGIFHNLNLEEGIMRGSPLKMPMESLQGVLYLFGGDYFVTKKMGKS